MRRTPYATTRLKATDEAKAKRDRYRARTLHSIEGRVCEWDGCYVVAQHRHHIDGNTANNIASNIGFYCASHHLLIHHPPEPPKECGNCGKLSKPQTRGMCRTCYAYWFRTGRMRPWQVDGRREGASRGIKKPALVVDPTPCSNCGETTKPSWRGRCRRCYDYWRLHDGSERECA